MQAYHTTIVHGPVKIIPNNIIGKFKIPTMKSGFYGFSNNEKGFLFILPKCSYLCPIKLYTKLENQPHIIYDKID